MARQPFISIVDKILAITKDDDYLPYEIGDTAISRSKENPAKFTPLDRRSRNLIGQAKVREYEQQIDQLVCKLYSLPGLLSSVLPRGIWVFVAN